MYTWGNSDATATTPDSWLDGTRDFDYTGTADNSDFATIPEFIFYVAWSNPNSTEQVAKDGMMLTVACTLTTGADAKND